MQKNEQQKTQKNKKTKRFLCFLTHNRLLGALIERMRSTPMEASDYCKKEGNYVGKLSNVIKGSDVLKRCLNLAEQGDLESIKVDHPEHYIWYKSTYQSILKFDLSELNGLCRIWINAHTRCGKNYALHSLKDVFVKTINKWWDGYRNEKYVLISDVEPDHWYLIILLMQLKPGSLLISLVT